MQLLSIEGDYGLRAIIYLSCRPKGKISYVSEIAHDQLIPLQFLFKILRKLVRKGLVKSYRGPRGGYALAKDPGEISFLEVIESIDGPLAVNRCQSELAQCMLEPSCKMFHAWQAIQMHLESELKTLTIADLLRPAKFSNQQTAVS